MTQTAAAAIIQNKKILLLKRSQSTKKYPGCWTFPGGKSEKNETPEETVIREVKEETSLDFYLTKSIHKPANDNTGTYIFTGEAIGKIKIQKIEIESFDWFRYNEAINLKIAFSFEKHLKKLHESGLL